MLACSRGSPHWLVSEPARCLPATTKQTLPGLPPVRHGAGWRICSCTDYCSFFEFMQLESLNEGLTTSARSLQPAYSRQYCLRRLGGAHTPPQASCLCWLLQLSMLALPACSMPVSNPAVSNPYQVLKWHHPPSNVWQVVAVPFAAAAMQCWDQGPLFMPTAQISRCKHRFSILSATAAPCCAPWPSCWPLWP